MVEAVPAAGGSVTVREYPGVGHEAWQKAYTTEADGVLTWMFAPHKGAESAATRATATPRSAPNAAHPFRSEQTD